MMEKNILIRTAKYLKGNTTLNEKRAHEDWMAADPENQKEFERLKKLWEHSDLRLSVEETLTEHQWDLLEQRLQEEDEKPVAKTRTLFTKRFYYAAASLALLIVAGYFWPYNQQEIIVKELGLPRVTPQEDFSIQTQLATTDQLKTFSLPDGSQVWLDENSMLTYDDDFNASSRNVSLIGRAFFDVQEDSTRAFVISAKNTKIRVLGTSFNVSAAPEHNTVEVTVVSGKVAFDVMEGFRRASISLGANEKGVYYMEESLLDKRSNDDPNFLQWMEVAPTEEVKKSGKQKIFLPRKIIPKPIDSPKVQSVVEPKKLLDHRFQWKKNIINQTVVEGEITNYSDSVSYEHFLLKITCFNEKQKKEYAQEFIIDGPIAPGETVTYKKTFLIDWLSNTSDVEIKLENVVAK